MIDVRTIFAANLRAMGADGLYNEDGECGCGLDDLMPCMNTAEGLGDCQPAYEMVCPCCGETIFVSCDQLHARAADGRRL